MPVTLPDEYRDAYFALEEGLSADPEWKFHFDSRPPTDWAGLAVSGALVLVGPNAPLYVVPSSNSETQALRAFVFTPQLLLRLDVSAQDGEGRRTAAARAVPLTVESLDLAANIAPWSQSSGRTPPWPGVLDVTVRIAGEPEPIAFRAQPHGSPERYAAAVRLIEILRDLLQARSAEGGPTGD